MKITIKTIALLMLLISINLASAQSFTNQALVLSSNEASVNPVDKLFDVNVQNNDGQVYLVWNLPVDNIEGYYITERSDDGITFKPIALKHFNNVPASSNEITAMHYSIKDKTPVTGTVYYKFTKSTLQGEVIQSSVIPYISPSEADFTSSVSAKSPQP
jgi:hypothetical protein